MAYLPTDDKQQDQSQGPQQSGQPNVAGSAGFNGPSDSGSTVGGGAPVSTAGVGKGGTGGWTNIQAYINANRGINNGAADAISQKVGGQINQEKQNIDSQAGQAKQTAQNYSDQANDAKQNYGSWLNQGAQQYQYAQNGQQPQQNQQYQDYYGKLQNALNLKYQGPSQVNYQRQNDTQRYQDALGNDQGFRNLVNDYYRDQGGGRLTAGQRSLQDQLDLNNDALNSARSNLSNQFSDLGNYEQQQVGDANQAINRAKEDVGNLNFGNLLQGEFDKTGTDLANAETNAKSAYQQAYNSSPDDQFVNIFRQGIMNSVNPQDQARFLSDTGYNTTGYVRPNTVAGVQQIIDDVNRDYAAKFGIQNFAQNDPVSQSQIAALNDFYTRQQDQYKDTGDAEKRRWNMIHDLLGSGDPLKTQGFNVRA